MTRYIDLSHEIKDGMVTYKGLPAPHVCDWMSFDQSHGKYAEGTEFSMQMIELHSNTGTYIDTPRHRYRDGHDLTGLALKRVSNVPAICVRTPRIDDRIVSLDLFEGLSIRGRAVLIATGWSKHFGTDQYYEGHPYLAEDAAEYLRQEGAALVGIDSYNIDCVDTGERPIHSLLLGAEIPIVEHLTNLESLPSMGFRFSAVPPRIRDMGTFPVRAHAIME